MVDHVHIYDVPSSNCDRVKIVLAEKGLAGRDLGQAWKKGPKAS